MIGYPSSKEFSMAAIRGEVDGTILVDDSAMRYSDNGQLRALAVMSRERAQLMPKVPTIFEELKLDEEATWWLDFREDLRKIGRLLVTPPGVAKERLDYLRQVSRKILNDKDALAEFEQRNQPALYGEPEEMTKLVKKALDGSIGQKRLSELKHVITEKYY